MKHEYCPIRIHGSGLRLTLFVALAMLGMIVLVAFSAPPQNTSAIVQFNQPMAVQTSLAACTWPTGVATTGMMAICPVNLATGPALALSYQGGAFVVPSAAPAGVISFNGRTGAVVLTKADVSPIGLTAAVPATSAPVQ
jgi:hypothetical protein